MQRSDNARSLAKLMPELAKVMANEAIAARGEQHKAPATSKPTATDLMFRPATTPDVK